MTAEGSFGRLDDDYPAYTTDRAAEMIGATQGFLGALGGDRLITPLRSEGGPPPLLPLSAAHRRPRPRARRPRHPVEAACRIIILEDQLEEAQPVNAEYRRAESRRPADD